MLRRKIKLEEISRSNLQENRLKESLQPHGINPNLRMQDSTCFTINRLADYDYCSQNEIYSVV